MSLKAIAIHSRRSYTVPMFAALSFFVLACVAAVSQTTVSTGSIQGTITDPTGAIVAGAKITITDRDTGQIISTLTTATGTYTSGALIPGNYVVQVEAKGFKTLSMTVNVQVGVTASGNFRLLIGEAGQVIEVQAGALQVDTEQAGVQGVLNIEQIDNLPINGRNFLDLAQLEPGVQIQDGGTFDPTKKGFSSISFGGRFGRTARIEVDGVDISDENVGTTTQDIPQGAIQEFQLGQSMLDLSTELTSSGSVNVVTKSGTNSYHGQGFYYFRDQSLNANLPNGTHNYFQRNQYGGNFGGAIVKNRLFFFADAERTKQAFSEPVVPGPPFQGLAAGLESPFREGEVIGKLDYQVSQNAKLFYRFSYDQNNATTPFVPASYQPMDNISHARDHVVGFDFTTGRFTHSLRFGYMKFFNHIGTGVTGTTPFNPSSPIELAIGPDLLCINSPGNIPDIFCSGQPLLAPQSTPQSDHQIKYDGTKILGSHILRYGGGWNHIHGGGFAGFLADGPAVNALATACGATCMALPGGATNPLNYPAQNVLLGNGEGFSTEQPAFGFPGGGLGPDNRISWYMGDSWKIRTNLTLTYGLRYVRDTGRTDSDLPGIPQLAQFDNQFYSGLEDRVRDPGKNFAPQLGLAWDPAKNGKTVIRAGIGLFYENSIWNNVLFDRPGRLTNGSFLGFAGACGGGVPSQVPLPGTSTVINPTFCNQPIGQVAAQIAALQAQYQAAAQAVGTGPNGNFIGTALADSGPNGNGINLFYPGYRTPRSVQMNIGIQREIHKGTILTADYLRNISTHTLLAVDTNHVGNASYPDLPAAQAAINATLAACGVASINAAIAACPGLHSSGGGATISDFAGNGLDSGYAFCPNGQPCGLFGKPVPAFPGINPNVGGNQMLFPIGRAAFNALQLSLKQDVRNPFAGVRYVNLQVSYQLSRYVAQAQDSDFVNSAFDYSDPGKYIGPNALDRTHQFSFGGTVELPAHFRVNVIGHFYSPLAQTLFLPVTGQAGGIFVTDINGDGTGDGSLPNGTNGTVGSIVPGTNLGSFGRGVSGSNINQVISNFNQKFAGTPTPAGQALITNNLFTLTQLQALGGVMQPLQPAPANQADDGWLRDFDFGLTWTYRLKEHVQLQPGVSFFNLMNFANFDAPKNLIGGVLDGQVGSANGTSGRQPDFLRIGTGSGVFGLGSPRVVEFQLKLSF